MKNNIKNNKLLRNIFYRYLFLLISIIIFTSNIFLKSMIYLFTNLSYYFLLIFDSVKNNWLVIFNKEIAGELLLSNGNLFYIVESCIATTSYILISLIFLSMKIDFKVLREILLKSFLIFSFFNLIRIFLLMVISIKYGYYYFDQLHLIFYQGLSGIITALIIIYYLRKEKIKKMYPFFTDIKSLIKIIKN